MVVILNTEGFAVNERQLAKIRKQNGLWMREFRKSKDSVAEENTIDEGHGGLAQKDTITSSAHKRLHAPQEEEAGIPAEVIAKRQERQARLMAESEERLKSRTRRRRTRGWAGLPPDEGMGPRFPSELTLGESIVELNLDKKQYRTIRQAFERICLAHNVIKKTLCGPEKWTDVKNELIGEFPQLQTIFDGQDCTFVSQTQKPMALDVICMDVTKRLRTSGQHVTIADAKNTLSLTPEEGREVRAAFDAILKADFFTGKLESTKEHWEELKDKWIKGSTRLRMALSLGQADPAYTSKMKAIESIARDVQKRNRDYQTKRVFPREDATRTPHPKASYNEATSSKAKSSKCSKPMSQTRLSASVEDPEAQQAPNLGTTLLQRMDHSGNDNGLEMPLSGANPMSTLASQALAQDVPSQMPVKDYTGMQIDPSLLEAASLPSQQHQQDYSNDQDIFTHLQQATSALQNQTQLQQPAQKSIYFRLSPMSVQKFPSAPRIWLDTVPVGSHNISFIRSLALAKTGLERVASVKRIEGLSTGESADRWEIGEDDEMEAYLLHVGTGKATFIVEIV